MSSHQETMSAVFDAAQKCSVAQEGLQAGGAMVNEIAELLQRSIGGTDYYNRIEEYLGGMRAGILAAAEASEHLRMGLTTLHGKLSAST